MKDSKIILMLSLSAAMITLFSACAPYRPGHYKSAVCNELNSQMVFSGSTANSRKADIERAQEPMVARSYHKDNCSY